ncbi:MAG: ABC transporter substrate-binding protein [Chloroflexi bacterium]|nr:ABC transporter substrate-binding protein [Chloroflexota bacterium]
MRKSTFLILSFLIVMSMVLAACAPAAVATPITITSAPQVVKETQVVTQVVPATPAPVPLTYARNETLYTSGTQWGPPSSWNPFNGGGYAMGTIGLVYETLYIYDPLADKFIPWLAAQDMKWVDPTTLEIKLRDGITWTDGTPLTADDVLFTYKLADPNGDFKAGLNFAGLYNFLSSIDKVDNLTVDFKFKANPAYQEVGFYLWQTPIVQAASWSKLDVKDITGGANENGIGSGPYLFESHDQDRQVLVRNDNWWGIKAFGKTPGPKRIVDIVNGSNNVALGLVLQGGLDLSNNFLPGVATLVKGGYGVQTYYPEAPYMLSANVAALIINEQIKPLDDVNFRKAMAYAINTDDIVQTAYTGIVKAADPTGLLPIWDKYVDQDMVAKYGWSYDPAKAKQILADAGYKDVNNDKFVENKDGSPIALEVTCPSGWTDWMASIQIISKNAQAVGINMTPAYPDYGPWRDAQLKGTFQLSIQNESQMSSTPWSYYKWVFQNPIANIATAQYGNYGRYDNPKAFDLVNQLNQVKVGDDAAIKAITSQLQEITLTEYPTIPLWYNGLWSQVSNAVWTNWPSSADSANHYLPASWRGYWNMTGIEMLLDLKPAAAQ